MTDDDFRGDFAAATARVVSVLDLPYAALIRSGEAVCFFAEGIRYGAGRNDKTTDFGPRRCDLVAELASEQLNEPLLWLPSGSWSAGAEVKQIDVRRLDDTSDQKWFTHPHTLDGSAFVRQPDRPKSRQRTGPDTP